MQKDTKGKEVCTCSSARGTLSGWTAAKLSAWWSPVLCPRGEAKLTAALPPEQNDIVCTLSPLPPSPPPPPPPPVYAPLPFSPPLHECWQHKLHRSAVFPLCRSRSCMSSAYLCGMGLFKGERSLQGQCACVRACVQASARISSVFSPPLLLVLLLVCIPIPTLLRKGREPSVHMHHPLLFIFNNKRSCGVCT